MEIKVLHFNFHHHIDNCNFDGFFNRTQSYWSKLWSKLVLDFSFDIIMRGFDFYTSLVQRKENNQTAESKEAFKSHINNAFRTDFNKKQSFWPVYNWEKETNFCCDDNLRFKPSYQDIFVDNFDIDLRFWSRTMWKCWRHYDNYIRLLFGAVGSGIDRDQPTPSTHHHSNRYFCCSYEI